MGGYSHGVSLSYITWYIMLHWHISHSTLCYIGTHHGVQCTVQSCFLTHAPSADVMLYVCVFTP